MFLFMFVHICVYVSIKNFGTTDSLIKKRGQTWIKMDKLGTKVRIKIVTSTPFLSKKEKEVVLTHMSGVRLLS